MNLWHFEYSFDVDAKNRMLYGKIYGVWKKNTADAYAEEFKEVSQPLLKKPWSKLIDLSSWKIAHQDVIKVIGDLNRWCRGKNMVWAVYVINQQAGYNQLNKMFDAGEYRDLTKTFRNRSEAEQFFQDNGYSLRDPNEEGLFK